MTDFIGMLAACLTTLSFLPQAYMVIKTRQTAGISLVMYSMFTIGVAAWLAYGVLREDIPMIAANTVTLSLAIIILSFKVQDVLAQRRHYLNTANIAAE